MGAMTPKAYGWEGPAFPFAQRQWHLRPTVGKAQPFLLRNAASALPLGAWHGCRLLAVGMSARPFCHAALRDSNLVQL